MMVDTVFMPSVYRPPSQTALETKAYCELVLRLLQDVERNGIIFEDQSGHLNDARSDLLKLWPASCRKRAMAILQHLSKQNRLLRVSTVSDPRFNRFPNTACVTAFAVAYSQNPRGLLHGTHCTCADNCQSNVSTPFIDVLDYPNSDLANEFRRLREFESPQNTDRDRLADLSIHPLLRWARTLTIVDRYIGRSVFDDVETREYGARMPASRFLQGIEWLVGQFAEVNLPHQNSPGKVTIITGAILNVPQRRLVEQNTIPHFTSFIQSLARKTGLQITLEFYEESPPTSLPHSRYLITDQVAVSLEPGVDAFGSATLRQTLRMTVREDQTAARNDVKAAVSPLKTLTSA